MSDSRERFEAWFEAEGRYLLANGNFRDAMKGAYQAAERDALERTRFTAEQRCALITAIAAVERIGWDHYAPILHALARKE